MNRNAPLWRSLTTRIAVFTLAIFLISIWSLAFYLSRMLRADIEHVLGNQQRSAVTLLAEEINHELDDRMGVLRQMAGEISPEMLGDSATLNAVLERSLILPEPPFNGGIRAYQLDGTAIAEVPRLSGRLGTDHADIDSVATALEEGRSTISRPVIGSAQKAPRFGMTVPIRDPGGEVIGALGGVVNLEQPNFLDRYLRSGYGKTGGYALAALQDRLIIAATDRSRALASFPPKGVNPTIDRLVDGFEDPVVYVNAADTEILATAKRIPVAGWDMVVILPTAEAFAPIRIMQQRMLLATLLLSALVAGATWWMLRRQLSPIADAAKSLAALSDTGQPPQPLPIARQDEIGELIGGFNGLLETLGKREKALKESEAFKNIILNSMAAEIAVLDHDGEIQAVNERWRLSSRENGIAVGGPSPLAGIGVDYPASIEAGRDFSSADDALHARNSIRAVLDGSLPGFSFDYARPPEAQRWFTMTVMPLGKDASRGVVITHTDITSLKSAEQFEQFRNRILELLAHGEQLTRILEALVLGVEQLNPAMLCSILLLDSEGKHLVTGAAPSLPGFFNTAVDGLEIGVGVGSCGAAAFTGERVIVEDISTHPFWESAKRLAARAGLGACWSEPIRASSGQVLGTFAIYHREPHAPAKSDIAIIEQSARLASIAIERNLAAERLRESEAHYRMLTENVSDVIWRHDRDNRFTYISPADERLRGYRADEVVGRHITEVATEEGIAVIREKQRQMQDAEGRGEPTGITRFELPQRCKDGRLIWLEVLSSPERDVHGTITGYYGVSRDITKRKHEEEQVRQLAFYDPLTALPNRRLLNERLRQIMATSTRDGCHGAVMFVDLDNFKPLNDERGHVAGDLLLVEAANRLKSCVREMDTVARYGGDEFVLVISKLEVARSLSTANAALIAEKIRASLSKPYVLTLQHEGETETRVEHLSSASIGVALFIGHQASQDEIIKWADEAMYEAKQAGRNVIRFHEPGTRADCRVEELSNG